MSAEGSADTQPSTYEASGGPTGSAGPVQASASGFDWVLSYRDDAMTDGRVLVLASGIAGGTNDVELEVSCDSASRSVDYVVTGFDKQGQGASMPVEFDNSAASHRYTVRIDGGEPSRDSSAIRYPNQVALNYGVNDLVRANRLVLSIPFQNSDETYVVDQSGATFRNAVDGCLGAIEAARQADKARAAAAVRQQQELDAQPVTVAPPQQANGNDAPAQQSASDASSGWNSIAPQ